MAERDGCSWMPEAVTIGGSAKAALLRALREHGVQLNDAAEELFRDARFATLEHERVVEISARSVAELGFVEGATYGRLVARARDVGLAECPLELGPRLRLLALAQPDGADGGPLSRGRAPHGSVTIASPPLDDRDETPKGFYLRRVGGVPWLRGYRASLDHAWSPEDVLVFARGAG